MKRYYEYTENERMSLTSEQMLDAVKLEALSRGIRIPISMSEALRRSEFVGYQFPSEFVPVWEIMINESYSQKGSGVAYLTEEKANAALAGMVSLGEDGYGSAARAVIRQGDVAVRRVLVPLHKGVNCTKRINSDEATEATTEVEAFSKLAEECRDDAYRISQDRYNAKVRAEKKVEYLRLASGNEEIAKAFWSKVETTEWPT